MSKQVSQPTDAASAVLLMPCQCKSLSHQTSPALGRSDEQSLFGVLSRPADSTGNRLCCVHRAVKDAAYSDSLLSTSVS